MRIKILYLFFICVALNQNIHSQSSYYKHYTTKDGLPSNIVYQMVNDDNGYIWLSTQKGIVKYNGREFEYFNHPSILNQDIFQMVKDNEGRIWLKSKENDYIFLKQDSITSLNKLLKKKFSEYIIFMRPHEPVLINDKINQKLYTLSASLNLIEYQNIPKYIYDNYIKNEACIYHSQIGDEVLLLNGKNNIIVYNFKKETYKEIFLGSENVTNPPINTRTYNLIDIVDYGKHNFYYETKEFLYSISEFKVEKVLRKKDYEGLKFLGISNEGLIFQNTKNELFEYSKMKLKKYHVSNFETEILEINCDADGNVWFATNGNGIFFKSKYSNLIFTCNVKNSLLKNNNVVSFDKGVNNSLLITFNTETHFQRYSSGEGFISYPIGKNASIYSVSEISKDSFLLGNLTFVSKNNNVDFSEMQRIGSTLNEKYILDDFRVHFSSYMKCAYQFGKNGLWSSGNIFGLIKYKLINGKVIPIYYDPKIPLTYKIIKSHLKDKLFLATISGIYLFDNKLNKIDSQFFYPQLHCNIRDVALYKDQLYIVSDKNGLNRLNLSTHKLEIYNQLKNTFVNKITIDTTHHTLWISSSNGLWYGNLDNAKNSLFQIQKEYGLPTNEINCVYNMGDTIFVGTSEGLCKFKYPLHLKVNTIPKIYLRKIQVNGNLTTDINSNIVQLNHSQNNLKFVFDVLSYESMGDTKLNFRLKKNEEWKSTPQLNLEFNSLSPGKYNLEYYGVNAFGNKSEIKNIFVIIDPPFYQSNLFRILSLISLIAVTMYYIWYITRKEKKEYEDRLKIEKRFATLNLKILQSQLNSHFIFNSLNSIQRFIIKNNTKEASDYLSTFAKLIRGFLDNSKSKSVSIGMEKELLANYMSLEKL